MKDIEDIVRGEDDEGSQGASGGVARSVWLVIIIGVFVASLAHRLLSMHHLEHTSLVFIGIPALIGIVVVLMPRSTSVTGVILKAITLALAMSGIVLGEGFVCILFAAPLFYLVGIVFGIAADWQRSVKKRENRINGTVMIVLLALGPSSLEGVIPGFEFGRDATVTRTRIVAGTASDVEAALGRVPSFERELPAFFKLGFPTPGVTGGEGLTIGAERRVEFLHGSHHPGSLVLRVASRTPHGVTFRPAHDDSYITHWLSWRDIDVEWREISPGQTEVSWTLRYRRRLDPAWYFAPLERYATGLAAGYLIDTLATPNIAKRDKTPRAHGHDDAHVPGLVRHAHVRPPDAQLLRDARARRDAQVLRDSHVLPGSTNKNLNPSPWDQGEGQGRGFELSTAASVAR